MRVTITSTTPNPEQRRIVDALFAVLVDSAKHANVPLTVESLEGLDWNECARIACCEQPSPAIIREVHARVKLGVMARTGAARKLKPARKLEPPPKYTLDEALEVQVTFGKNKGRKLGELSANSVRWYADECWIPHIQAAAQVVLPYLEECECELDAGWDENSYNDPYGFGR